MKIKLLAMLLCGISFAGYFSITPGGGGGSGDVVGPASSTNNSVPAYSGLTGKLLLDPGAFKITADLDMFNTGNQDAYDDFRVFWTGGGTEAGNAIGIHSDDGNTGAFVMQRDKPGVGTQQVSTWDYVTNGADTGLYEMMINNVERIAYNHAGSPSALANGLRDAINASSQPITATADGGVLTVTGDNVGQRFFIQEALNNPVLIQPGVETAATGSDASVGFNFYRASDQALGGMEPVVDVNGDLALRLFGFNPGTPVYPEYSSLEIRSDSSIWIPNKLTVGSGEFLGLDFTFDGIVGKDNPLNNWPHATTVYGSYNDTSPAGTKGGDTDLKAGNSTNGPAGDLNLRPGTGVGAVKGVTYTHSDAQINGDFKITGKVTGNLEMQEAQSAGALKDQTGLGTGTTHILNWNDGNFHTLDLADFSGDLTLTLSNPLPAGSYFIKIIQSSTARTITWPASVKWKDGGTPPTLSTANDAVDAVSLAYDGTDYIAAFAGDFQ